ncbi:MAG: sigma-70 family RNA polymerase sigma factor [Planctomycetaceae bacterium]|nr:sigma-70 family RNA polymerase sigma factor [Planctomycetaceae bacterium]
MTICEGHVPGTWDTADTVSFPSTDFDSVTYFSSGHWETRDVVTVIIVSGQKSLSVEAGKSYEDDAALLSDVQAYLWCRAFRCAVPQSLEHAWDVFFPRFNLVLRQVFEACHRNGNEAVEYDEFRQEAWRDLILAFPGFRLDPVLGSVSAWLAGFARRRFWRLANSRPAVARKSCAIDAVESRLISPHRGPEDELAEQETFARLETALDRFCGETPHETYQVFFARVFRNASLEDIADVLGMSPGAARTRFSRAMQAWRASGRCSFGHTVDAMPRRPSVLPDASRSASERLPEKFSEFV